MSLVSSPLVVEGQDFCIGSWTLDLLLDEVGSLEEAAVESKVLSFVYMWNSNRAVGGAVVVTLVTGLLWWQHQEAEIHQSSPVAQQRNVVQIEPATPATEANAASASAGPGSSSVGANAVRRDELGAFAEWATKYRASGVAQREALVSAGVEAALDRERHLRKLATESPREFLAQAMTREQVASFPPQVQQYLEKPISGMAKVRLAVMDGAAPGTSEQYRVTLPSGDYEAFFVGGAPVFNLDRVRPVHGVALGNQVVLSGEALRVIPPAEVDFLRDSGQLPASANCANPGSSTSASVWVDVGGHLQALCDAGEVTSLANQLRLAYDGPVRLAEIEPGQTNLVAGPVASTNQGRFNVLIARFRFTGDPTEAGTLDQIAAVVDDSVDIFRQWSYGTVELVPVITPVLTLPRTRQWYAETPASADPAAPPTAMDAVKLDCRAALADAGYALTNYKFLQFYLPSIPNNAMFASAGTTFPAEGLGLKYEPSLLALLQSFGRMLGGSPAGALNTRIPNPLPGLPPGGIIDPHSSFGHESLERSGLYEDLAVSLTFNVGEGNPFDVLGAAEGNGQDFPSPSRNSLIRATFNSLTKMAIGWLPLNAARVVTATSTNRLYAFDGPSLQPEAVYSLAVRKDVARTYWMEHRRQLVGNQRVSNGVLLHWGKWAGSSAISQLLDARPSTADFRDSAVVLGQTFADTVNGVYITPTTVGTDALGDWIEVVVQVGNPATNRLPAFDLVPSSFQVGTNEPITFTAQNAVDADGDALAFHWEFSDGSFGENRATIVKTFPPGQYTARCEVSDFRGGLLSREIVVTVGSNRTSRIHGQILDIAGNPVANARIALVGGNGLVGFTDNDGRYTIVGVPTNAFTHAAYRFGYDLIPMNFFNPIALVSGSDAEFDFLAIPLPSVSVRSLGDISLPTKTNTKLRFSRSGDPGVELTAKYRLDGTGVKGTHFDGPRLTNAVLFPPGVSEVDVDVFGKLGGPTGGGTRSLVVSLLMLTNQIRFSNSVTNDGTNDTLLTFTNSYLVPGWFSEGSSPQQQILFQTEPVYVIGQGEAVVQISDPSALVPPKISLVTLNDSANENRSDVAMVGVKLAAPLGADLSVAYSVSGTASNGVDFDLLSGSLVIPKDQTLSIIQIRARPDLLIEGAETVVLTLLTNPALYVVDAKAGASTNYIVDDDLPIVTVAAHRSVASEMAWETNEIASRSILGSFRFTRSGNVEDPLVVGYLLGGSATNGLDYRTLSGSITIPPGSAFIDLTVDPIFDRLSEGEETVLLQLSSSPVYTVGNPGSAEVTIQDGARPVVEFLPFDAIGNANENGGAAVFQVIRYGPFTNSPLVVKLVTGGIAEEGSDYAAIGQTVTIPAGQRTVDVPVIGKSDRIFETNEFVVIRLLPSDAYNLGRRIQAETRVDDAVDGSLPTVSFDLDSSEVSEAGGQVQIGVRLSRPPGRDSVPLIVEYRVLTGTASYTNDYFFTQTNSIGTTGYLAFDYSAPEPSDAIALTTNISVTIVQDTLKEANEKFFVSLFYPQITTQVLTTNTGTTPPSIVTNYTFTPTNFVLSAHRLHSVTIIDDDASTVSVEALTPFAYESGAREGAFRIKRESTNGYDQPLTVKFEVSGTANPVADYLSIGVREVTFSPGSKSVTIPVKPQDDSSLEGPETVVLRLTSTRGAQIDSKADVATVTIVDDDGTIEFPEAEHRVVESQSRIQIPVRRTGDTTLPESVEVRILGGTADPEVDYTLATTNVTFLPGETRQFVDVAILDDDLLEATETVLLSLENASGGVPLGGQTRTTLFIESDDAGFAFASPLFSGRESGAVSVKVVRFGSLTREASVRVTANVGETNTATLGADFEEMTQVLQFAPGVDSQTTQVGLLDDALLEGDETFSLALSEPVGGVVSEVAGLAFGLIRDDECSLEFVGSQLTVYENVGVARVTVRRQGGSLNAVSVDYSMVDDTAINGTNYTASSGTLQFAGETATAPGQATAVLEIPILDDDVAETPKRFQVTIRNPRTLTPGTAVGSAVLGTVTNLVVTIQDNDLPGGVDTKFARPEQLIFTTNSLEPRANTAVNAIALQPDGRVIVGGNFTRVNGYSLSHIARVARSGDLDIGFNPGVGADGTVLALQTTGDGRIFMGGTFLQVGGLERRGLALVNADGLVDPAFEPGLGANGGAAVRALALSEGGYLLVGGDFATWDGQPRSGLVRLDPYGGVDTSFAAWVVGAVHAVAVQADGRIVVGGSFTSVVTGGTTNAIQGLARLNPDGSLDETFVGGPGVTGTVRALAIQPEGQVLIGGDFTTVGGVSVTNLARLSSTGEVDASSQLGSGPNGRVLALGVHSSGKIYLAGEFTLFDGQSRNRFARLRADGALDTSFDIGEGANDTVRALLVAPNSSSYIGGQFDRVNGQPRQRFARILGDEQLAVVGVEFVQGSTTVSEGVRTVSLAVKRTGDPKVEFSIAYRSVPQRSTALEGADYLPVSGTLTFAPGVLSTNIVITLIDDNDAEITESIAVELTGAPVGVELGALSTSFIFVEDNESSVTLSAPTYAASETTGSAIITLLRQGSTNFEASVVVETADGGAREGFDYVGLSRLVTFGTNESVKTVQLQILNDRLQESVEDFRVNLKSPRGLLLGLATATVNIADDDFDRITFVASALVADGNSNGAVDPGETVTLSVALRNVGTADTTNLTVTLLSLGDVVPLSEPQSYGLMPGEGAIASRPFTFRNTAAAGGSLKLTFQMADGGRDLGQVSTEISLGAQTRVFANTAAIRIQDAAPASPYPSSVQVSGLSGNPLKVSVTLDGLSHGSVGDLDLMLVAPNGERSIIMSDIGGNRSVSGLVLTLDDEAANPLPLDASIVSGTYRPRNSLVLDLFPAPAPLPNQQTTKQDLNFRTIDPNGQWSLYVLDDTAGSEGEIKNGWKLNVVTSGILISANDLGVEILDSSDPVVLGQNLTYTLRVANHGPGGAAGVEVRQALPTGARFISATGGATTNSSGEVRVIIANLPVGGSVDYQVVVRPTEKGTLTTTATVASSQPDVFTENNLASQSTLVSDQATPGRLTAIQQGGQIRISWPAAASGTLEFTPSLSPVGWTSVGVTPTPEGDRLSVTLPVGGGSRFYRLVQP